MRLAGQVERLVSCRSTRAVRTLQMQREETVLAHPKVDARPLLVKDQLERQNSEKEDEETESP